MTTARRFAHAGWRPPCLIIDLWYPYCIHIRTEGISGASGLASAAGVILRLGGAVRLCPEKRTSDKSLIFNRMREGSDLLPALVAIDFLGTARFLPSFSGC
jgi:hypothetical protein